MKQTVWELRRRSFLKGLGLGAAMLPTLAETQARAQAAGAQGRLIVMVKGNGVRPETFWPTWAAGRPADGSLATATLPHVTAPLAAFKDRLSFLDGVTLRNWLRSEGNTTGDNGDAHHNWGSLLTGELPSDALTTDGGCQLQASPPGCRMQAGAASLDCLVGKSFKQKDAGLAFDSLHLSLNVDDLGTARRPSGMGCPSWFERDRPNPPEPDAKAAFAKLFGGDRMGSTPGGPDPVAKDRVRLLDFVGRDLQRFARRLGTEDRLRIEGHLDSVKRRQDELNRLLANPPALCVRPAAPTADYIVKKEEHVPALSRFMMDLIVDAMACGLTRTACYSLFDTNAYHTYFSWLSAINPNFVNQGGPKIGGFPSAHFHAMAHGQGSEPGTTMYRDGNRWLIEQYAYMLDRLATRKDGTGSLLDSTLVLWVDSLANGGSHTVTRLPWILAGNVDKRLPTGRHVQLPPDTAPNGLFLAIAETLGVAPASGVVGNVKFGQAAYAPVLGR